MNGCFWSENLKCSKKIVDIKILKKITLLTPFNVAYISSIIWQKGESQNGGNKKTKFISGNLACFFSCYLRFQIRLFALLPSIWPPQLIFFCYSLEYLRTINSMWRLKLTLFIILKCSVTKKKPWKKWHFPKKNTKKIKKLKKKTEIKMTWLHPPFQTKPTKIK